MRWRPALLLVAVASLALLAGCQTSPPPDEGELPDAGEGTGDEVTAVATGLDTVWEVRPSPGGRIFFTERAGTVHVLDGFEDQDPSAWTRIEAVEVGESGLMGLALHPSFPDEPWVYLCHTHRGEDDELANRIVRVRETADGEAGERQVLLDGIDAARFHDGCRIGFGPEGLLYATMGDAAQADRAQDPVSPNGKVLRLTPAGEPAGADEEGWHPAAFAMGHRNPQGLDFHPDTGAPFVSEHGPENHDEVNHLVEGGNYGWPQVRGADDGDGRYEPALWSSGEDGTVAPAGGAFVDAPDSPLHGAFLVATLEAAQLHVFEIAGDEPAVEDEHVVLDGRFGRLRAATWTGDALLVSTSNEDGRGNPGPTDDRILRVPLPVLEDAVAG